VESLTNSKISKWPFLGGVFKKQKKSFIWNRIHRWFILILLYWFIIVQELMDGFTHPNVQHFSLISFVPSHFVKLARFESACYWRHGTWVWE
jgi:hypothetical protein